MKSLLMTLLAATALQSQSSDPPSFDGQFVEEQIGHLLDQPGSSLSASQVDGVHLYFNNQIAPTSGVRLDPIRVVSPVFYRKPGSKVGECGAAFLAALTAMATAAKAEGASAIAAIRSEGPQEVDLPPDSYLCREEYVRDETNTHYIKSASVILTGTPVRPGN
jgi:hypothetical protein